MNIYLDASVVVALVTKDIFTARAEAYIRANVPILIISDFAAAEFASVIARRVRIGEITETLARVVFAQLDAWMIRSDRACLHNDRGRNCGRWRPAPAGFATTHR